MNATTTELAEGKGNLLMGKTRMFVICLILCGAAISATAEEVRPGVFRTPDGRFENLKDYPFSP